jgi:hypothetical protein
MGRRLAHLVFYVKVIFVLFFFALLAFGGSGDMASLIVQSTFMFSLDMVAAMGADDYREQMVGV